MTLSLFSIAKGLNASVASVNTDRKHQVSVSGRHHISTSDLIQKNAKEGGALVELRGAKRRE